MSDKSWLNANWRIRQQQTHWYSNTERGERKRRRETELY